MFRSISKWCIAAFALVVSTSSFNAHAQGEALFKAKCATCHQPHKDGTGPKLFEARKKWAEGGAKDGSIIKWVQNWQSTAATDPYAAQVANSKPTSMSLFPDLSAEEIESIFDYVDAQPQAAAAGTPGDGGNDPSAQTEEEGSLSWIWIVSGIMFVVIIMAVGGVKRQLNNAVKEQAGEPVNYEATYLDDFKAWAWKNKIYVGIVSLILVLTLIVTGLKGLGNIGVFEAYQPNQPIDFPHSVHAGLNGIDCKYCHNSADKSRTAGIPTVNVCMNCHKQVTGSSPEQEEKIKKIYSAAGWDPVAGMYTGNEKPIVWNKVHVLPDHVYFNHSQHVSVGGIDCKQCHGDMTKQKETARVVPVSELNKIEGNVVLSRPTLTMGWCIECHDLKEVSSGSLDSKNDGYYNEIHKRLLNNDKTLYKKYLKDGIVTVKELGGWECAKCHY